MRPEKGDLVLDPEKLEFHASCASGLHEFLEKEVLSFKLRVLSQNRGGVHFQGRKENLYKFFLSSRFSSRISFVFHRADVEDADDLYDLALRLPWEVLIPKNKTFRIESFTKENLNHSRFAMYRLKDAIKDRIRAKRDYELEVGKEDVDVLILLRSARGEAVIQISISSQPFHKRGYRQEALEAPIRENIAQALLAFSEWDGEETLIDPMCGSGTILIEAALIKKWTGKINYPLLKESFIFWKLFGDIPSIPVKQSNSVQIFGYDSNPLAIKIAKENAAKAGVSDWIDFKEGNFTVLKPNVKKGYLVTNPPYGVRLGEKEELKELYFQIGKHLKNEFSGFVFTMICGDKSLLGHLRLKANKELSLTIAQLKGKFVQYKIQ